MIILGIDPGTAAVGYGVVELSAGRLRALDYGCLATSPADALPTRLLDIHAFLSELIETHRPELVGVERLFFSRNAQTALGVGQARGVVLLAAAQAGVPVREATPSEVKSAVAGHGAADKDQVARMVALILGLAAVPTPDDAADALAIAIWTANRERPGERLHSAVVDRAAVAPLAGGTTPYDRAVRAALQAEASGPRGRTSGRPAKGQPPMQSPRQAPLIKSPVPAATLAKATKPTTKPTATNAKATIPKTAIRTTATPQTTPKTATSKAPVVGTPRRSASSSRVR